MVNSFKKTFIKRFKKNKKNVERISLKTYEAGYIIEITTKGGLEINYNSVNKEITVSIKDQFSFYNHQEGRFYQYTGIRERKEGYPADSIREDKELLNRLKIKIKQGTTEKLNNHLDNLLEKKEKEYIAKNPEKILTELIRETLN